MAEKKTRYTNADLKPDLRGPQPNVVTYGPWQETRPPRSLDELVDSDRVRPALEEWMAPGIPSIAQSMQRARQQAERASGDRAAEREQRRLTSEVESGQRLRNVLKAGLTAGSFVPGPVGIGSMAALSGLGVGEAVSEGNPMGAAAEIGLAALPYGVGRLRNAGKATSVINPEEAERIAEGLHMMTGLRRAQGLPQQLAGRARRAGRAAAPAKPPSSIDALLADAGPAAQTPFQVVGDAAPVAQASGGRDVAASIEALIKDAFPGGVLPPKVLRPPMGVGSRPSTPQFAQELEGVENLSEEQIADMLDAISWSRR